jgi:hypothetical protein
LILAVSRKVTLNPGAQEAFVLGDEKYSAYIGGLGSGKTFAGLLRGLRFSLQPKVGFHAPHGVVAVSSYPALNDIIIPALQELMDLTGLADWDKDYSKSKKELTLINGSLIRLRSLDDPQTVARGPQYSWFFIDEGRNVNLAGWKNLTGRLRQKGYKRAGFVCSTPNGFDWMYDVFHPDGAIHATEYADSKWYNAAMFENVHLDDDYIASMVGGTSGRFYEQEIMGHFIGIVEGGVFDQWDPITQLVELEYDPSLPLYSFWDFGIGDPGVCIFAQVKWVPTEVGIPGKTIVKHFPYLLILDAHEAVDWTAKEWAEHYKLTLETTFGGARTKGDYGDPAGTQRNPASGSSVIADLNTAGVPVRPVKRRPQDYAIRILNNMMAGGRVFVDRQGAKRVSDAFSSHKWHMKDGVRVGVNPVHDWTSHFVDAVRYGASVLLPFSPRDSEQVQAANEYEPTQWGYVFEQLEERDNLRQEKWLGGGRRKPEFIAPTIRVR